MASTKYQDNRGRTVMHIAAEQVCLDLLYSCACYHHNDNRVA